MNRREILAASAAWGFAASAGMSLRPLTALAETTAEHAAPAAGFGFEDVSRIAAESAAKAYEPPFSKLVGSFENLNYDQYRGIRFRRDRDPWGELGNFTLDLLPPGGIFHEAVQIALVNDGVVEPKPFDPLVFDYQPEQFPNGIDPEKIDGMGWSGFRLRTPLNRPGVMDEVAVFQGASYFRAVARGTSYGQSARGLSLGTGSAEGEEFPIFRHFWLHRPAPDATGVLVHALLDTKSVAAAFEFLITPGEATVFQTRLALFPRRELTNVGVAPLTSMFWFGPNDRSGIDDYRPAVHDSDGLQMATGPGQHLWRALSNPATLQLSSFMDHDPRGFGLAQRARRFADYQDAEARYDLRPSAWVAPRGGAWGPGSVALVEIPVKNEFNDNIVAAWNPAGALAAQTRHDFAYDLVFSALPPDDTPVARVLRSMTGASVNQPAHRSVVIDFDLTPFDEEEPVTLVEASDGEIIHPYVIRLPEEGVMRLSFEYNPRNARLAELSAVLKGAKGPVSETWMMRWTQD